MRNHFFKKILNFVIVFLTTNALPKEKKILKDTADSPNKLFSFGQQTNSIWEKKMCFYYWNAVDSFDDMKAVKIGIH